ncbi:hypothetical protein CF319_g6841 [Tilletia indica]|nr:hypothetical protein CF319_g6841 [Tilletia indica]
MADWSRLPEPVLQLILKLIRKSSTRQRTLATLSTCSRFWRRVCAASLFKHPVLEGPRALSSFSTTLYKLERLGRYVKTLVIEPIPVRDRARVCEEALRRLNLHCSWILSRCHNLRGLRIWNVYALTGAFEDIYRPLLHLRAIDYTGAFHADFVESAPNLLLPMHARNMAPILGQALYTIPDGDVAWTPEPCTQECSPTHHSEHLWFVNLGLPGQNTPTATDEE